jgi:hypothetical protein
VRLLKKWSRPPTTSSSQRGCKHRVHPSSPPSNDIDLTDDLADLPPAQAEDFDYKVRVDAEVKSSEGNDGITKSAILFIVCDTGSGSVAVKKATFPWAGLPQAMAARHPRPSPRVRPPLCWAAG